ncbi:hypothetical protein [Azohydromonas australica]|uniref:hypothetical protein n=1 Tax=Azohydromonas australica TaxID=364039 RepID=UPI0012EBFCB3|nr:hypothetical protein [Azohydromonas australica]
MDTKILLLAVAVLSGCGGGGGGGGDDSHPTEVPTQEGNATADIDVAKGLDDGVAKIAAPRIVNRSFERKSYFGWTPQIPWGISEFPPYDRPAGSVEVIDSWNFGVASPRLAVHGSQYLSVATGNTEYLGTLRYNISAKQTVLMRRGESLTGSSFYYNGDFAAQDSVWVRIFDDRGRRLATPWIEYSGGTGPDDQNAVPFGSASQWTRWSWIAPRAGLYTVKLGASTMGDNRFATYGFHDDIAIVAAGKSLHAASPDREGAASLRVRPEVMRH